MAQGSIRHFKVNQGYNDSRADVCIAAMLPNFTRSSLKQLFEKGLVSVGDKVIKASYHLRAGDQLNVDTRPLFGKLPAINLNIIFEDRNVIVLNKPAGILTHAKGGLSNEATVASFIKKKLNDKKLTGNRARIVHRLDRGTRGAIITAKNELAQKWRQKQFSTRKVSKTYRAIVEGVPEPREAIIDAPIERSPKKPQTFRVGSSGRPAQTEYKLLKILNQLSILELRPLTGRTHQIRVHLKYIGHPIVGDRVYGHAGKHLHLHAKSLGVTLPDGRKKQFEAPEPDYFTELANS